MTKEELKALHEKMSDTKTHLCGAVLDDNSTPLGMHGDAVAIVALAVQAIIVATQELPEERRTRLRVMAIADLSNISAENRSVLACKFSRKKKKRSEQQQLH